MTFNGSRTPPDLNFGSPPFAIFLSKKPHSIKSPVKNTQHIYIIATYCVSLTSSSLLPCLVVVQEEQILEMSRSPIRSQQHPWNSSKRHNMTTWRDEKSGAIDGSNAAHVKLLLEDLQTKYDQMINLLKADLVDTKMQQEEALSTGLMRLPKSIRQMSVREFNKAHNCDVLSLLKGKDGVQPKASKKRDYNMTIAETPAPRSRNPNAPMSELRTARRGEGL